MNTDLGNVVLGLECCRPIWFESVKCKNKCPYDVYGHNEGGCVDHLISDAISLLKTQEPIAPKLIKMYPHDIYECGNCGHRSVGSKGYKANFCPECGRELLWE